MSDLCCMCEERPPSEMCVPCGHVILCSVCSSKLQGTRPFVTRGKCIYCNQNIDRVLRDGKEDLVVGAKNSVSAVVQNNLKKERELLDNAYSETSTSSNDNTQVCSICKVKMIYNQTCVAACITGKATYDCWNECPVCKRQSSHWRDDWD